jgi:hypothetical protein
MLDRHEPYDVAIAAIFLAVVVTAVIFALA